VPSPLLLITDYRCLIYDTGRLGIGEPRAL